MIDSPKLGRYPEWTIFNPFVLSNWAADGRSLGIDPDPSIYERGRDGNMKKHSDPYEVWLNLDGQVQDDQFIKFLEKLARETGTTFGTEELFALSCIREEKIVPERLRRIVAKLRVIGAVELSGRKNMLSSRFYKMVGRPGEYTRLEGLDRDTNMELVLKHLEQAGEAGAPLSELWQVLPHLSRDQIRTIVKKRSGRTEKYIQGGKRNPADGSSVRMIAMSSSVLLFVWVFNWGSFLVLVLTA